MNKLRGKLLLIAALVVPSFMMAEEIKKMLPSEVELSGSYAHNLTYGSYGLIDIRGFIPINNYFEMAAGVRFNTTNRYALTVQLRPKFRLPVGEMFLEDRIITQFWVPDKMNDVSFTLGLGYRMEYVSVMVGMGNRLLIPVPYKPHTTSKIILEPFNLLYRVECFVRPKTSVWNVNFGATNIEDFQMERMWQPMFFVGGWWNATDNWQIKARLMCKPTGMFHMNATYYGVEAGVGCVYMIH